MIQYSCKAVSGDVTIINPKPVTTAQAKQIIFSILEMQGFTIVRYDNYVKVVRSKDTKTHPINTPTQLKMHPRISGRSLRDIK